MPDIQKISVAVTGDQLSAMRDWRLEKANRQDDRLRQAWNEGKGSGGRMLFDVEEVLVRAQARWDLSDLG